MKGVLKKDLLLGLAAGSVALLIYTGKFGYFFGQGDQDEFIPYLLRLLDPSLYSADWFINQQLEYFNVRTYFVYLVYPIAKVLGPSAAVRMLYFISFLLISLAIYFLSLEILKSRTLSLLAPLSVLSLSHKWTLGSNDLVYSMLVPEMLAWPFAIWAMHQIIRKSFITAGLLLGIASWFQVLVGVQSACVWTIVLAVLFIQRNVSFQECLGFLLAVSLSSLPSTGPIILSLFSESVGDTENLFYILAAFRNPFHHLFFSFSFGSVVKFFVLFGSGVLAWFLFLRGREFEHLASLLFFVTVTAVLLIVNLALTELSPVLFMAKLQWFKLTVLIKMLAGIFVLGAVRHLATTFFTKPNAWTHQRSWQSIAAFFVVIVSSILWLGWTSYSTVNSNQLTELEEWVEDHTPVDALFLVPPSNSSFRTRAKRSIYINYASFPYRDPDMTVWFERMQNLAPVGRPERGIGIKVDLDQAFYQNSRNWSGGSFNAKYALVEKDQTNAWGRSEIVFENDDWELHLLNPNP